MVGSVIDLKSIFPDRKFDLILCAEVLEHLPFKDFDKAIMNISAITNEFAILTLPRSQKIILDLQFNIKLPKLPYIKKGLFLSIPNSAVPPEHHWELDSSKLTSVKEVKKILKNYFKIIFYNRFRFRPYHHYFMLKKIP